MDEFKDDSQKVISKARKRLKSKMHLDKVEEEKFIFSEPTAPKTKKLSKKRKTKDTTLEKL